MMDDLSRLAVHTITTKPWDIETAAKKYAAAGVPAVTVWRQWLEGRELSEVKTLLDENRVAGSYEAVWRGRDNADRTVAAGVYFYRLEAGRFQQTRSSQCLTLRELRPRSV